MKQLVILAIIGFLFQSSSPEKDNACYISGKVINRNSDTLILVKQTKDARFDGVKIPIKEDGTFEYQMNFHHPEAYQLVFKEEINRGMWRPVLFFPDNDTVRFELYSRNRFEENKITGSPLTDSLREYKNTKKNKFMPDYSYWAAKKDSLSKAKEVDNNLIENVTGKLDSLKEKMFQWRLDYIASGPNLFGYSKFLKILNQEKNRHIYPVDSLEKYYNVFKAEFPDHPYTTISGERIKGLQNIKKGGHIIDFAAPNKNGTKIRLSNYIAKNRLTLLDLWAHWCGPCIGKSKKTIPIYKKYKDSGFNVLAVMGGLSSKEKYLELVEKYKYPWPVLGEVDKDNHLWRKYNVEGSGGGRFLIDSTGTILAVDPSFKELKDYIQGK
ncbi:MAG: AhpC/TSA family protein [Bacteroidales bacterium]|nr:AhpC/TSA family protein [Bacteroidales bacterium]